MMPYYIWIPLSIIICVFATICSFKCNTNKESISWFLAAWFFWAIPIWTVVSRYSKNLLLDGLIYDCCMVVSFSIITYYLTTKYDVNTFSYLQIIGIFMMICGIFVFKIGG